MNRELICQLISKMPFFISKPSIIALNYFRKIYVSSLKTPKTIIFFVTNKCNARCKHCFYWKNINQGEELSLEEIKKVIKSLKHRISTLAITGGEPFLRDDLVEICEYFCKTNKTKKINLLTNGFLTDKIYNNVKEIVEKCNAEILVSISLDGTKDVHDKIRGVEGLFDKTIETAKKLKTIKGLRASFLTTISDKNIENIEKLKEFTKDIGLAHSFQFVRGSYFSAFGIDKKILNDFNPKDASLPEIGDVEKLSQLIDSFSGNSMLSKFNKLNREYILNILKNKKKIIKCYSGRIDGVIYPNGDVSMCELTKPFANLKNYDYNFYRLWNSKEAKNRRKELTNCFCTHTCHILNSMPYDTNTLINLSELPPLNPNRFEEGASNNSRNARIHYTK